MDVQAIAPVCYRRRLLLDLWLSQSTSSEPSSRGLGLPGDCSEICPIPQLHEANPHPGQNLVHAMGARCRGPAQGQMPIYSIGAVARMLAVPRSALRAWEQRYS